MALLDMEGFDRETDLSLSNWFDFGIGSGNVSADGAGAFGYGRACIVPYGLGRNVPNTQVFWWQAHIYVGAVPGGDWAVKWNDGGASQCLFGFEADLRGKVWINGGSSATPSPLVALNSWNFFQIRVNVANTGGYYEIWVNGVLVHTFTGDTQITANAYINQWAILNSGGERFDNVAMYTEAGNAPNERTPETRIYAVLPTADTISGWTPSAGSDSYAMVDEQPEDGDTTYISTAGLDLVQMDAAAAVAGGNTIYAVGVEFVARKDDAGTNVLKPTLRISGNDLEGDAAGLSTSYQRFRTLWDQDPYTLADWTVSGANNAGIGVVRTS